MSETDRARAEVVTFRETLARLRAEVARVIVGQEDIVEGVPGLGKTMLVRTLAEAIGLEFSRIQFTPDLMPADILGTTVIDESATGARAFEFRRGPVFANVVLADEVNRATPKTQSALLEAMQERRVTVGRATHELPLPHLVLATQNPLEMEGTYPLPEAQLDRFFFKLDVRFPDREELHGILDRTTGGEIEAVRRVVTREEVLALQALARRVPVARHVQDYAVRLVLATHPGDPSAPAAIRRFVRTGASPRGAQALLLGAKIRALVDGRFAPGVDDVRATALPALRHRVLLNFEGEAEGQRPDGILGAVLEAVPESSA